MCFVIITCLDTILIAETKTKENKTTQTEKKISEGLAYLIKKP